MGASSPREITIVGHVIREICNRGGWAEKTHGTAYGRVRADVTGCINGRRLEIEVKRPGKAATAKQLTSLERWAKVGAITGVVTSVDELRSLLDVML